MKRNGWFSVLKNLTWLTQLGFSLATPPILTLALAWWVTQRFGVGAWVFVPAALLGVGASVSSFMEFARIVQKSGRGTARGGQPRSDKDRSESSK